jgi:serine/threonine protein kinase
MGDAHDDPMIGLAIGRFVVRSRLAEGGMGAVYVAVHERLPVRKVVKVLLPEYSRNAIIRQRFEREAAAASRLDHRHIIKIDDFGTLADGQLFLMMPFLDGRSLEAHLRHNVRLTLHHTFHILAQLCGALQHLHEAGVVHRDLKPGNVFLCETHDNPYEVVLIDLGIAVTWRSSSTAMRRTRRRRRMCTRSPSSRGRC